MRECQQDLISRALDRQIDIHCPFEDLPKSDQEWVIKGDLRPDLTAEEVWESGGWYGIRGFFDWMESRAYKMHVRVFLEPLPRLHSLPAMSRNPLQTGDAEF